MTRFLRRYGELAKTAAIAARLATRWSGEPWRKTSSGSSNNDESALGIEITPEQKAIWHHCQIPCESKLVRCPKKAATIKSKNCENSLRYQDL
jgi:hypothetical protein